MSVFIKGIEKPKNCYGCDFNMYDYELNCYCKINHGKTDKDDWTCDKPCPIVEVPVPHGDLIDRQKLIEDNKHLEYPTDGKYRSDRAWAVGFNVGARHCNEHAVYAKPVIEAEGTE